MAVGVYLLVSSAAFLAAWVWLRPGRRRGFARFAVALAGAGLVAFAVMSEAVGVAVFQPGTPVSYDLPADYLDRGVGGWAVMLVGVLGALSPAILALFLRGSPISRSCAGSE